MTEDKKMRGWGMGIAYAMLGCSLSPNYGRTWHLEDGIVFPLHSSQAYAELRP